MTKEQNSLIDRLFLDPQGKALGDFEKALIRSVRLFRLWWKGSQTTCPPSLSAEEMAKLVSDSKQDFNFSNSTPAYAQLESCIKTLFCNMRFNKNNMMNVHPTPLLPSVISSLFAMLQNPNNLSPVTSPATTTMEEECISQMANLVGFHYKGGTAKWGGNLVSCGSLSNLTALMVAREKAYGKSDSTKNDCPGETGLYGAARGIVLTSDSAHYSIRKAVRILGLGDRSLVRIPVATRDEIAEFEKDGKPMKLKPSEMDYSNAIERMQREMKGASSERQPIISAVPTLGTVNTGTIEPIKPLVKLRNEYGFHLHVDAAIGGFALGLNDVKAKASGVEYADSITMDPHKLGYIPYPCSALIFHNKSDLGTIAMSAPYVGSSANTIEGSRPGTSAAALWIALKTLGVKGYSHIIDTCIGLTRDLASRLVESGFQVPHEIDLNTVCFTLYRDGMPRKKLNTWTSELHARLVADGKFLLGKVEDISGVMVRDKPWQPDSERVGLTTIKAWIMNPSTCEKDLESLVDELKKKEREVAGN